MEFNFSGANLRKLAVAAVVIVSVNLSAFAEPTLPVDNEKVAAVTAMGVSDGSMVFNLRYDNNKQDKLNIVLSDVQGNVLYKEVVSTKSVNKTFKTSTEISNLVLIVTNYSSKKVQKFEISNEKRYVDELVITPVQ